MGLIHSDSQWTIIVNKRQLMFNALLMVPKLFYTAYVGLDNLSYLMIIHFDQERSLGVDNRGG